MIDMKMTVVYTDGRRQDAKVRPFDTVAFEEHFDMALTTAFNRPDGTKLSHVYYLAYLATDASVDFKEWLRLVDTIEVDNVADADPLAPTAKNGSTRPSLSLPASPRAR